MTIRLLCFMATGSPVGGVATWLDHASVELVRYGYEPIIGLVRGMQYNNPNRFRAFHSELNTIEVDGRGMDREGRILACLRTIKKIKPHIILPLGVIDAVDAAMRAKENHIDVRLIGRAQGNLPPMLADLQDYRDGFDQVVCVGALTRHYLIQHAGFQQERVVHIPNGAAVSTTSRLVRKRGEPLRLGYIGRLTDKDKRVLDIPDFCRALDTLGIEYCMSIVGGGPCEAELHAKLEPFGNKVKMTGPKTSDEIYSEILPNLDVLMMFSSSETFGIALAEAMMNNVVPVTSRYIGFESERLVVEGEHGLSFPVGDMNKAADAVARLINDPNLLKTLSANAAVHAHRHYTWARCFESWNEVMQRTLNRAMVPPPSTFINSPPKVSGRLNRLGIPSVITDGIRRMRRTMLGIPIPPGGEEWPLYRSHHSTEKLAQITRWCEELESNCAGNRPSK